MEYVFGNTTEGFSLLEELKVKIKNIMNPVVIYKYYRLKGNLFHSLSDNAQAISNFQKCLLTIEKYNYISKIIETKNSLAEILYDTNEALNMVYEVREMAKKSLLNKLEYGKGYYIEADILLKQKQYEKSIVCAEQSYLILEEVGYESGKARALNIKGSCLMAMGKYAEALNCFKDVANYYRREGIYPNLRVDNYWQLLKCTETIGQIDEYRNIDNLEDMENLELFPKEKIINDIKRLLNGYDN